MPRSSWKKKGTDQSPHNPHEFERLCNSAEFALRRQNFEKAQEYFKRLCHRRPERPSDLVGLTRTAKAALIPTKSIKILRLAHDRLPDNPAIKIQLANTYLALGVVTEAEAIARSVISEDPSHKQAAFTLTQIAEKKDLWQLARDHWLKAEADHPKDITPIRRLLTCDRKLGRLTEALAGYRKIFECELDRPVDHYNWTCLKANLNGGWISVKESYDYTCRFPEDKQIAALHAANLRFSGHLSATIDFLKVACQNGDASNSQLLIQFGRTFQNMREYERAAEYFLAAHQAEPNNLNAIIAASRCLIKADKLQAAEDLLTQARDGEPCDRLQSAQAAVVEARGDYKNAIRCCAATVQICPNINNISNLSLILTRAGYLKPSLHFFRRLEQNFADVVSAWQKLAVIASQYKDYQRAYHWIERYLKVSPDSRDAIRIQADVLWQMGESKQAWYANLALATSRAAFLSKDNKTRERELESLKKNLNEAETLLTNACDHTQRAAASRKIHKLISRPTALKMFPKPDSRIDDICRQFRHLEERGDAKGVVRLIDKHLPLVMAHTMNPNNVGGLLYRAALVCQKTGWYDQCRRLLEKAIWINKRDNVLIARYRALLRQYNPSMTIEGHPRVAVLILTWQKNLSRAKILAQNINDQTGRSAITLIGNPDTDSYIVEPQPYGYKLEVPCSDGYLSLPEKLLLAYRYIKACSNCSGVLKLDDDIVIEDFQKFEKLIIQCHSAESGYVGQMNHQYTNPIYHHGRHERTTQSQKAVLHNPVAYCDGGKGYYLSRKSLEKIFKAGLTHFSCNSGAAYEDVFFGEILASAGVKPMHKHMPIAGGYMIDCYEPTAMLRDIPEC